MKSSASSTATPAAGERCALRGWEGPRSRRPRLFGHLQSLEVEAALGLDRMLCHQQIDQKRVV